MCKGRFRKEEPETGYRYLTTLLFSALYRERDGVEPKATVLRSGWSGWMILRRSLRASRPASVLTPECRPDVFESFFYRSSLKSVTVGSYMVILLFVTPWWPLCWLMFGLFGECWYDLCDPWGAVPADVRQHYQHGHVNIFIVRRDLHLRVQFQLHI